MPKSANDTTTPAPAESRRHETLFVSSLEKGMKVLQAFGPDNPEMGVTEIALATGLDKSAAQRFSNTLHALGYLTKDAQTRRYRPSLKLLDAAYTYLWTDDLARNAAPRLIEASRASGETLNLARLDVHQVVYVIRIPNAKAHYPATLIGRRLPAFATSGGRAMLSRMEPDLVDAILDASDLSPMTAETVTDRTELLDEFARSRQRGYAVSIQQCMLGEVGVAAPVLDIQGRPVAAVVCPSMLSHTTPERIENEIAPLVMETAAAASQHPGGA